MTDHGHELEFGLFPTPAVDQLDATLELVQLAEVLGYDLVSIQDHPYQAGHADTWTLLSVLGARTSAIRLAPNVANLPLRQPVILAKAAATLDLVTGGRVELGLGTGVFTDAIEAAGGPRRSPKQSVDALVEAVGLIRAFWAGGTLRVEGEHYRAKGLRAGPSPAHRIPIWLGAYKPRMLRITGRLADAWVPSMGYADPPDLPGMNTRIDEAAVAAGRDPEQIRRMYNISGRFGTGSGFLQGRPADWVEQLAALALDQGMSTFILGSDDPDDVRRFAQEVVPAVKELVTQERGRSESDRRAADEQDGGQRDGGQRDGGQQAVVGRAAEQRGAVGQDAGRRTASVGDRAVIRPTPAPEQRLAGDLPWDESSRPTLGEPPEPSYTAAERAAPQHLIDIHDGLRAELTRIRDIVDQVRQGQLSVGGARSVINTMTMRQNNWTLGAYCESYCRIVTGHHTLEDRSVFPHLRRSEPGVGVVLERLHQEHEVIADVIEQLDRALVALVGDGTGPQGKRALEELQEKVDLLTDTLLSHLAYEERELIGPLARHGFD